MPIQLRSQRCQRIAALSARVLERVALELIDWILDFLHDDFDSLKNCSLVCKAWLPTTRFHLFRSITITERNAGSFFHLVSSRHSRISGAVKVLRIENSGRTRYWKLTKSLLNWITTLGALRSLILCRADISGPLHNRIEVLKAVDLRHLVLHDAKAYNVLHLLQIPSLFSRLESLSIRHIHGLWGVTPASEAVHLPSTAHERPPLTLRALSILSAVEDNSQILEWIPLHEPALPIRALSIGVAEPLCGRIVGMLHGTLEHLELKLNSWSRSTNYRYEEGLGPFLQSIDLSQTVQLRTLRICIFSRTHPMLFTHVENLLNQMHSPLIQSVSFELYVSPRSMAVQDICSKLPFKAFARALAKHLDSLTEIVFDMVLPRNLFRSTPSSLFPIAEAEESVREMMGYPIANLVAVTCSVDGAASSREEEWFFSTLAFRNAAS